MRTPMEPPGRITPSGASPGAPATAQGSTRPAEAHCREACAKHGGITKLTALVRRMMTDQGFFICMQYRR